MNKLRPILLVLTAASALSLAHPAKANLITNGGFEEAIHIGWSISGGVGPAGNPHSGNQAAGFLAPSGSIAQNVTTTPSTSYVVDFWLATSTFGPGGINPNVSVNVLWGGTSIFSQIFTSSSPYTEHTFTVTGSQSPTTALEFQSVTSFGVIELLLDDVSVTPAGVPDAGSTLPLLGSTLLAVAVLRRKLNR